MDVKNANSATILVSIGTNFKNYSDVSGDADMEADRRMQKIGGKSYPAMKKSHIKEYQKYFNRVELSLGETDAAEKSTIERLKNFQSVEDPHLIALYFQFGRYLLISSSQPGGQPANLQGIWNDRLLPPGTANTRPTSTSR